MNHLLPGTIDGAALHAPPRRLLPGIVALAILTVVVYLPALNGPFLGDDIEFFGEGTALKDPGALRRIWLSLDATSQYYPMVFSSFWLEYRLWGDRPFGYHLVNVALHICNALLVWRICAALEIPGAFPAALVFAVHPLHVESVAWIIERKNVLSGFFYLLAILAYLRFSGPGQTAGNRRLAYAAAVLCSLAAVLSKSAAATCPAAMLLLTWCKTGRLNRGQMTGALVIAALCVPILALTIWMEQHQTGARFYASGLTIAQRVVLALYACWFYLGKTLWPVGLSFVHERWSVEPAHWRFILSALAAVGLILLAWRGRRRLGRGPLTAVLFFGGTLLPALGFVDFYYMRYSFVADRFAYLASLAPICLVCGAGAVLAHRFVAPARRTLSGVAIAVILVLAGLARQRASLFGRPEALWADAVEKTPGAWLASNNLGRLLADRGRIEEAQSRYEAALRYNPDYAEAHNNLAVVLAKRGRIDEAVRHLRRAAELIPSYAEALNNLGNLLLQQGRIPEAIEHYRRVLALKPDLGLAHCNMGLALALQGQRPQAEACFREALRLDPELPVAHLYLGEFALRDGRPAEASASLERAVALRPQDLRARLLLARALAASGRVDQAGGQLREVLRIEPSNDEARRELEQLAPPQRP